MLTGISVKKWFKTDSFKRTIGKGNEGMNLQKLFAAQAELDKHIYEQHPVEDGEDRLAKKILALQVELGECANEWRGFKYWSDDREPRTEIPIDCPYCYGKDHKAKNNALKTLIQRDSSL